MASAPAWAAGYRAGVHHAWTHPARTSTILIRLSLYSPEIDRPPGDGAPEEASADYHAGWLEGLTAPIGRRR